MAEDAYASFESSPRAFAAATCLMRSSVGDIVASEGGEAFMAALHEECLAVAAAEGQPVPDANPGEATGEGEGERRGWREWFGIGRGGNQSDTPPADPARRVPEQPDGVDPVQ